MTVLVFLFQIMRLFDGESAPAPVEPTPVIEQSVTGTATWYSYKTGQAAAGPALRELLGKNWRGQTVVVSSGDTRIEVVLTDWCQCYFRMPDEKLIDLDYYDFQKLASPSRGILKVTVSPAPSS